MEGIVIAVNISDKKGIPKVSIPFCFIDLTGLVGDAHAGAWHRQVSLLAIESIQKMQSVGISAKAGTFAENITTQGLTLYELPIGTRLRINNVILEITQIGKVCHEGCAIRQKTGECIMPHEGIFAKVISPGMIYPGDHIIIELQGE